MVKWLPSSLNEWLVNDIFCLISIEYIHVNELFGLICNVYSIDGYFWKMWVVWIYIYNWNDIMGRT